MEYLTHVKGAIAMSFSNAVRELLLQHMQAQNITVSELARRANLRQSTVDSVLHKYDSNPRADTIHKLMKALGQPIDVFFSNAIFKSVD